MQAICNAYNVTSTQLHIVTLLSKFLDVCYGERWKTGRRWEKEMFEILLGIIGLLAIPAVLIYAIHLAHKNKLADPFSPLQNSERQHPPSLHPESNPIDKMLYGNPEEQAEGFVELDFWMDEDMDSYWDF